MYPSQSNATTPRPRQQAGLACDECRRRKLRCDREQPQCGVCRDSGVVCNRTTTRQPRGPKKGHLRALQSRIFALERRLGEENLEEHVEDDPLAYQEENPIYTTSLDPSLDDWLSLEVPSGDQNLSTNSSSNSSAQDYFTSPTPLIESPPLGCISDLIKQDLDHLYFDRVHSFCPILNKRHYFSRSRRSKPDANSTAFTTLQYAMWTIAASTSSQFQHVQDELYGNARLILDSVGFDTLDADYMRVEKVQAWALLTIYELMRVDYRRGWMSAGKLFRSAILLKLHTVDRCDAKFSNSSVNSIELEEWRRTFWMVYEMDCFLSLMEQLPMTFDQQVILTRLPMPELNFQNDDPMVMPFPTEPQDSCPQQAPSVFTESIRLASLCGQGLWHYQQSIVEQEVRDTFSLDFWARHHRLEADIARSAKTLSNDSCVEHYLDSLSLLVHMTVQAASLTMFKSTHGQSDINTSAPHQATEQVFLTALPAAQRIVALSAELVQLSYFQVHPFIPILLFHCADFIREHAYLDPLFEMQAALQSALGGLQAVSKIAQDCLVRLDVMLSA